MLPMEGGERGRGLTSGTSSNDIQLELKRGSSTNQAGMDGRWMALLLKTKNKIKMLSLQIVWGYGWE